MRLLNTTTLSLRDFTGSSPPYAILSHRWSEDEVSYDDYNIVTQTLHPPEGSFELDRRLELRASKITPRSGYKKIVDLCKRAREDQLEWAWIDTCCIDKRSSSELSEAIISMVGDGATANASFVRGTDETVVGTLTFYDQLRR